MRLKRANNWSRFPTRLVTNPEVGQTPSWPWNYSSYLRRRLLIDLSVARFSPLCGVGCRITNTTAISRLDLDQDSLASLTDE